MAFLITDLALTQLPFQLGNKNVCALTGTNNKTQFIRRGQSLGNLLRAKQRNESTVQSEISEFINSYFIKPKQRKSTLNI